MRHVTIKDIARIADVSTSTVSRALSGSKELSEATRERIVKICNEQGYRVNALARSLIRSRTNVIGLIVPEVTNPFYAEISLGIETHARELGYNVMLCNSQQDTKTTEELFGFLISHQVDGIILANSHSDAPRWLQQFPPLSAATRSTRSASTTSQAAASRRNICSRSDIGASPISAIARTV